ncbi:hypothetical protein BJ138DRAFT_253959 [Hygrophoropsis aurantiaca]|uniref:Uncharacterized protein n=1 Tax=Hygrophoropsis aurantiaca TaxID=72124 RepID=A0ACB7ZQD8_9AGAM|nr:hypothetical protein BJ138DRAFT_253959 [Hygrophoropsis aurantiaca]
MPIIYLLEIDISTRITRVSTCSWLVSSPLLQFQELQNLDLIFAESIVVDDTTLLAMADAWPNISALTLNEGLSLRPQFAGSHVTPSAFITFLERCPNLTNLTIPFDFSVIDHANFDPFSIAGLGGVTSHA